MHEVVAALWYYTYYLSNISDVKEYRPSNIIYMSFEWIIGVNNHTFTSVLAKQNGHTALLCNQTA